MGLDGHSGKSDATARGELGRGNALVPDLERMPQLGAFPCKYHLCRKLHYQTPGGCNKHMREKHKGLKLEPYLILPKAISKGAYVCGLGVPSRMKEKQEHDDGDEGLKEL